MASPEVDRGEIETKPPDYFDVLSLAVARSSHARFKGGVEEWTQAVAEAREAAQGSSPGFLQDVTIDRRNESYTGPFSDEVSGFLTAMRMSGTFSTLTTRNKTTYVMSQAAKEEFKSQLLEELGEQMQALEEPLAKLTEIIDARLR